MLRTTRLALIAAGTLALAVAVPAVAQDYGPDDPDAVAADDNNYYDSDANGPEEVDVTAPRIYQAPDSHVGIPGRVSLSRAVTYSDLDLTTRDGARELRYRIRQTASEICYDLDDALPGTGGDNRMCYRDTVNRGLAQARAAVQRARYAEEEY